MIVVGGVGARVRKVISRSIVVGSKSKVIVVGGVGAGVAGVISRSKGIVVGGIVVGGVGAEVRGVISRSFVVGGVGAATQPEFGLRAQNILNFTFLRIYQIRPWHCMESHIRRTRQLQCTSS